MKSPSLLLAAALLVTVPLFSAQAVVLLNDTFADGNRDTQNLPDSAAFYFGSTSGNAGLEVVSNTLQYGYQATTGILSQSVAYFTNAGSPVTLAVGDKLTASFTFSGEAITNTADSLRVGMFNSGGTRVNADYSGVDDTAFNAYTGYSFFTNLSEAGSNSGTLRQRTGTNDTLFASSANTNLLSSRPPLDFVADTTYTLSLEFERLSASEMRITFSDSQGNLYAVNDTVAPFTSFDTFALFLTNGSNADVTYNVDNVTVTYTPVPEPGSAAALLSGLAAVVLVRRRRTLG